MTVSSQISSEKFNGNGVTTIWDLPFRFFDDTDLLVYRIETATQLITPFVLGVDYTLSGAGLPEQFGTAPGKITTTVPLATGYELFVQRVMEVEQLTDIINQGKFFPEVHEDVFDRLTMLIQQNGFELRRAIKVPPSDPAPNDLPNVLARADKFLSFDTAGNPIAVAPVSGTAGDLAVLLASTATGNGDAMIGVKQPFVGAIARTQHDKNAEFVTAADFGAVGLGADETVQLKAARDANAGPVELMAGRTYRISSQIAATGNNQGFFVRNGWATVILLTGTGQFDRANYSGTRYDANACGFLCQSFNDYLFSNIRVTLDAPSLVRTVKALAVRACTRAKVNVEAYGFKECQNGVLCLDSSDEIDWFSWVRDCGTSNDTLATMQITGLDMDNIKVGADVTTNSRIDHRFDRILLSGAALTKYGMQTDGFNASASGGNNFGVTLNLSGSEVGEGADLFGSHMIGSLCVDTAWAYGLKLIHGARLNEIVVSISNTGGAAVVLGGSNVAAQTVAYNRVTGVASGIGNLGGSLQKCGIQTDGNTATYQPENNHVQLLLRTGGAMNYAVVDESGKNNIFEYEFDAVQIAEVLAAHNLSTIRRIGARMAGYSPARYYGGGYQNLASTAVQALAANTMYFVPFDVTDGHLFTSSGVFVSTSGGGSARFGVYRMERGVPTKLVKYFGETSISGTGQNTVVIDSGIGVYLAPGAYALCALFSNAHSVYSTPASPALLAEAGSTTLTGVEITRQAAFAYAALPATAPAITYNNINVPNIFLRG